ncbi:uncharacterized protein DUF481 [Limimaricola soesokkakensis]|uniref:Uncharacterized protein DUF481 n=1 Tax=Limimaricola soesokkakensis TaxID=1343159 RepID=A0A1X7A4T4_9RHOB|nr:DUF481 domain-containing protein [Limimaricola soesokkakensis]PSK80672.1 uncharacterized protein DUF481 [Limimaricola soesokkakensis]SLN70724.1 hypothetical protein LOS8367_03569 [Limimaricola soesokkakensis]
MEYPDFLFSEFSNLVTYDAGVNFRVTDPLSPRFSYRTEYTSDSLPGFDDIDSTIGASLVYGFCVPMFNEWGRVRRMNCRLTRLPEPPVGPEEALPDENRL